MPRFLSGGVGFQSTQLRPRSSGVCGKTSTARAFILSGTTRSVTSNSNSLQVPAMVFESATSRPFSHTLARKLIPSKCSWTLLPRYPAGTVNCVRYHHDERKGLPGGIGIEEKVVPMVYVVPG